MSFWHPESLVLHGGYHMHFLRTMTRHKRVMEGLKLMTPEEEAEYERVTAWRDGMEIVFAGW
jgi:hypothetical protein